jgi:hypothetical protein
MNCRRVRLPVGGGLGLVRLDMVPVADMFGVTVSVGSIVPLKFDRVSLI